MRNARFPAAAVSIALMLASLAAAQGPPAFQTFPPAGDSPATQANRRPDRQTSFVSLFTGRGGPRLLVDYPWSRHRDASVEVRLVTGEEPSVEGLRPLGFAAEHFQGEKRMQVYDVQDAGAGGVVIRTLEAGGMKYEILGSLTDSGKPASCIARKFPKAEPPPGAYAVYCVLSGWSINSKLLSLELPPEYFAEPGKLKIWFLRGDTILWSQTLDWPGTKREDGG